MISIADPQIGSAERENVEAVFESGHLADGAVVREFEAAFSDYCNAEHGVATTNGTTALHTALEAVGIGPGDTVVTTPFSFIATANAARLVGASVEFVDIDPETFNLDTDLLERRLEEVPDVDAVIAVHLYGLPARMQDLRELASRYDFALIEDAAQAHGATCEGDPVGSIGDVACFSFYPTKNMTTGEGGMITTDRTDIARRARQFIDHGRTEGYEHASIGHNFRMTNIAASLGNAQLNRLPEWTDRRQHNASVLTSRLERSPVRTPKTPSDRTHVFHQYTIRYEDRDGLQSHLSDRGVGTGVYYPIPIDDQPAYEDVESRSPIARRAAREVLSLPVHPGLSEEDLAYVADAVVEFTGGEL